MGGSAADLKCGVGHKCLPRSSRRLNQRDGSGERLTPKNFASLSFKESRRDTSPSFFMARSLSLFPMVVISMLSGLPNMSNGPIAKTCRSTQCKGIEISGVENCLRTSSRIISSITRNHVGSLVGVLRRCSAPTFGL